MAVIFTELVRWVFVFLAAYILIRSIKSLLQTKNPAEVWAYILPDRERMRQMKSVCH